MSAATQLVLVIEPTVSAERQAVAGFLAGYTGNTWLSSATDLRLFAASCGEQGLRCFQSRGPIWSCSVDGWSKTDSCPRQSGAACRPWRRSTGTVALTCDFGGDSSFCVQHPCNNDACNKR
jgi:hypothetical protein